MAEGTKIGNAFIEVDLTTKITPFKSIQQELKKTFNDAPIKKFGESLDNSLIKSQSRLRMMTRDISGIGRAIQRVGAITLAPLLGSFYAFAKSGLPGAKEVQDSIAKLKGSFAKMGQALAPTIIPMLEQFTRLLNALSNSGALPTILKIAGAFIVMGSAIKGAAESLKLFREFRGLTVFAATALGPALGSGLGSALGGFAVAKAASKIAGSGGYFSLANQMMAAVGQRGTKFNINLARVGEIYRSKEYMSPSILRKIRNTMLARRFASQFAAHSGADYSAKALTSPQESGATRELGKLGFAITRIAIPITIAVGAFALLDRAIRVVYNTTKSTVDQLNQYIKTPLQALGSSQFDIQSKSMFAGPSTEQLTRQLYSVQSSKDLLPKQLAVEQAKKSPNLDTIKELESAIAKLPEEEAKIKAEIQKKEIGSLKEQLDFAERLKAMKLQYFEQDARYLKSLNELQKDKNKETKRFGKETENYKDKLEKAKPNQDSISIGLDDLRQEFISGMEKYKKGKEDMADIMKAYTEDMREHNEKMAELEEKKLEMQKEQAKVYEKDAEERKNLEKDKLLKDKEREGSNLDVIKTLKELITNINKPVLGYS